MAEIFTPNILVTKSYDYMRDFMEGLSLSNLNSKNINDTVVFLNKQNRYVYSLEHQFGFDQSDVSVNLKIVDIDGDFENQFLNESFYEKLMATNLDKYLQENRSANEFHSYFASILDAKLKIYLAYGVGDDLANWTDPIVCTLVGTNIDVANNGLRTYTYKFIPVPNVFFTPTPAKDGNDPSFNDSFEFGAVNISYEYVYPRLTPPSKGQLSDSITGLLRGFAHKVTNIPINNVITLIPDLDSATDLGFSFSSTAQRIVNINVNREQLTNYWTLNYDDERSVEVFYRTIFKNISYERGPADFAANIKQARVKASTKALQDYYGENQIKLDEQRKKIAKAANQAVTDPKGSVQTAKRKTQIKKEINQINDWLAQYTDKTRYQKDINLRIAKKAELVKELTELSYKPNQPSQSSQNLTQEIKNLNNLEQKKTDLLKSIAGNYVNSLEIENSSKITKRLVIRAEADKNSTSQGQTPFPDARQAILNVFTGINTILKNGQGNSTLSVFYESNLRWLKLFKKYKFIEDDRSPCLVIGDRKLILDLLYRNEIKDLDSPKVPVNNLSKSSNFYIALNSEAYYLDVLDIISRKKNSSSFSESLYIDELSFQNKETLAQLNEIDKMSKTFDIPIFVNNFRNANVLSYSLKNTENYLSIVTSMVKDDRLKILYPKIKEKEALILGKFLGAPINNPVELAKSYFDNALNLMSEETKNIRLSKIPGEDIAILDLYKKEDKSKWNSVSKTTQTSFAQIFKLPVSFWEFGKFGVKELEGLSFSQNSENVSYLNLAIQRLLRNDSRVKSEDLAAVSELIILLNESNQTNDIGQLSLIPGLRGPGKNNILSRVHEYSKKFALELSVKTLPFFHLSDSRVISSRALFFSKRISSMGSEPAETFDFFCGQYRIIGFRHVITTTECYSEFSLSQFGNSNDIKLKS